MKRFNNISLFGSSLKDMDPVKGQPVGERIVDDSHFIPMSEAVKQLSKSMTLDKGVIDGFYDFPDGRDDGRKVDVARLRPEIVELSTEVRKKQKQLKEELAKATKKAQDEAFFNSLKSSNSQKQNQTIKEQ